MDLLSVGSATRYAKNAALKTQWNLKKQSGDFAGHKKSLQDYVNVTKASSVLPRTDEADNKMSAIITKAQTGKKLSPDEWEYVRAKNPTLYEELREEEQEQENYEKALRRCKTKDEARRLHVSKLADVMTAAKNGDEGAIYRLNRLTRTMIAFMESKEYRAMPTEAEEAIARESERQAEREASEAEAEVREAEREASQAERTEDEAHEDAEAVAETETRTDAEAVDETKARTDGEPKAHAETVVDTKAEAVAETKAQSRADGNAVADAKAEAREKRNAVAETKNAERKRNAVSGTQTQKGGDAARVPRKAERTASPAETGGTTNAAPLGQKAYVKLRDAEIRRRSVDAKA